MPNYGYDPRNSQRYAVGSDSGFADYDGVATNDPAQLHSIIRSQRFKYEAQLKAKDAEYRELQSQWQALVTQNEVLEDDKVRLHKEKKELANKANALQEEANKKAFYKGKYLDAKAQLEKESKRQSTPPSPRGPAMTGAIPVPDDHLADRFNRKPTSSRVPPSSSVVGSSAGGSYYEAWGPAKPRRRDSVSGGPRKFNNVSVAHHDNPAYSAVPRSRPASGYANPEWVESGDYYPYPLNG